MALSEPPSSRRRTTPLRRGFNHSHTLFIGGLAGGAYFLAADPRMGSVRRRQSGGMRNPQYSLAILGSDISHRALLTVTSASRYALAMGFQSDKCHTSCFKALFEGSVRVGPDLTFGL